tara:strand:+ start:606 stop:1568 length:963 start_codon:yes stop_codon:yes gene_type:complete
MPSDEEWKSWLSDMEILSLDSGISQNTIDKYLLKATPASKILLRDRCQAESTMTLDEYLFYRIDKARIFAGKTMMTLYQSDLEKISNHFSIQPRFIISILGLESYYGKNQGNVSTIQAVSTLAFDRRRSDFYKKQLIATLKIIDSEKINYDKLRGSWGGALGMPQFIPTTYLESGYDWDKNDLVDIWDSYQDTFASIANYLTSIDKNPWNINNTWGREILPPDNIKHIYENLKQKDPKGCGAVKSMSIAKKLKEWNDLNFKSINGDDLPTNNNIDARLIAPDGINGRMFLVYGNYKNILYYNCSSYYAIAVGLLSDAIKN